MLQANFHIFLTKFSECLPSPIIEMDRRLKNASYMGKRSEFLPHHSSNDVSCRRVPRQVRQPFYDELTVVYCWE